MNEQGVLEAANQKLDWEGISEKSSFKEFWKVLKTRFATPEQLDNFAREKGCNLSLLKGTIDSPVVQSMIAADWEHQTDLEKWKGQVRRISAIAYDAVLQPLSLISMGVGILEEQKDYSLSDKEITRLAQGSKALVEYFTNALPSHKDYIDSVVNNS